MTDTKVRIFVSSPADVEHERAILKDIIERFAQEFLPYFQIQPILWEEEALTADQSFQAGLLRPADCNIVLVVLWTRLGSPLPQQPYGGMTGTEWEFFNAVDRAAGDDTPEVLVYKKTNPKLVDITDSRAAQEAMEDLARLEAFFQRNFFNEDRTFRRAFRAFDSDASFRNLVEVQLRKLLNRRIFAHRRGSERTSDWRGSPFRPERPFDISDERIFTGREAEIRDLLSRLQQQMEMGRGFLLISGPSGCGKTSLIRAGLMPRLVRPYQIEGVSVCRWCLVEPCADGGDPLAPLAEALCSPEGLGDSLQRLGLDPRLLHESLSRDPALVASHIRAALRELTAALGGTSGPARAGARLMVVVDPLDALLLERDTPMQSPHLLAAALSALAVTGQVWVLALVRSDLLGRLPQLEELAGMVDDRGWVQLEVPSSARIRQTMEVPALVAGLDYESRGTHSVVDSLEAEASRLQAWPSFLQGALDDLYVSRALIAEDNKDAADGPRRSGYLTLEALRKGEGLAGYALRRARLVWESLDHQAQQGLPMLCRALITLERTTYPRPVPRAGDLDTLEKDPGCKALVRALLDARLVETRGEQDPALSMKCHEPDYSLMGSLQRMLRQTGGEWRSRVGRRRLAGTADLLGDDVSPAEPPSALSTDWSGYRRTVILTHVALLEHWGPCQIWLSAPENRSVLQVRYQLTRQAQLWKRTECNREYLLGEAGFTAAERFAHAYGSELEPLEEEFLRQSRNHLHFERQRNALVRATGSVLVVLLLLVTGAAFWAWDASHSATVNLHRSRLEAAELAIVRGNTPSALVLALDAGRYLPQQAQETLSRAFTANRLIALVHEGPPVPGLPFSAALDDQGIAVATVDPSVGVRMWRLADGQFVGDESPVAYEQGFHRVLYAGNGIGSAFYGIAPEGVWRLPTEPGSPPDFPCGAEPGDTVELDARSGLLALSHALTSDEYGVCLLDLTRLGEPIFDTTLHSARIESLAFSQTGTRLVTASQDGTAKVLDTATGQTLLRLQPRERAQPLSRAVFDPGGEQIAIASTDGSPRIYGTDGTLVRQLRGASVGEEGQNIHKSGIRDLIFTPDRRFLITADDDGLIVRWDLDGDRTTALVLGHHDQAVLQIRVGSGGRRLLSTSRDKTARLWDLETGEELAVFSHDGAVTDAKLSADGKRVFTQSTDDGTARLWSVEPRSRLSRWLPHEDHVWHLDIAPSPDNKELRVATAGSDGRVKLWAIHRQSSSASPELLLSLEGHSGDVRRVAFSPSGELLASAGYDGTARVWDLGSTGASGRERCRLSVAEGVAQERVYRVLFEPSPQGRWLLTTSSAVLSPVALWDPATCDRSDPGDLEQGGAGVQAAAVQRGLEGVVVATGSDDGRVRVVRETAAGTWALVCDLVMHSRPVLDVDISDDGHWLVSASEDNLAKVMRIDDCGQRPQLVDLAGHVGSVRSAQFSPDGNWIVTASMDGTARVWSRDGAQRFLLDGHTYGVSHAEFSPDGRWILTASRDATVRFWQAPQPSSSQVLTPYLVLASDHGGSPYATFSADGNDVLATYWRGAALLWRIWADDDGLAPEIVAGLREIWGEERSRLALIREAARFRDHNRLDELRRTKND